MVTLVLQRFHLGVSIFAALTCLLLLASVEASPLQSLPLPREVTGLPGCTTNIVIPSPTEQCTSHCVAIQHTQKRCNDFYPCMCEQAPPISMNSCLQCTLDASAHFPSTTSPTFRNTTQAVMNQYNNACGLITSQNLMHGDPKTRSASEDLNLRCLVETDGLSGYPPLSYQLMPLNFRPLMPYMSFALAVLILVIIVDSARRK